MKKTKLVELTDRELAEGQYKYIKKIAKNTTTIKDGEIIWRVVTILGVISIFFVS